MYEESCHVALRLLIKDTSAFSRFEDCAFCHT
jgi:hypothetical protein